MLVEVQQGNQILQLAYEEFEARVVDGESDARTLIRFEVVTGNEFSSRRARVFSDARQSL